MTRIITIRASGSDISPRLEEHAGERDVAGGRGVVERSVLLRVARVDIYTLCGVWCVWCVWVCWLGV